MNLWFHIYHMYAYIYEYIYTHFLQLLRRPEGKEFVLLSTPATHIIVSNTISFWKEPRFFGEMIYSQERKICFIGKWVTFQKIVVCMSRQHRRHLEMANLLLCDIRKQCPSKNLYTNDHCMLFITPQNSGNNTNKTTWTKCDISI